MHKVYSLFEDFFEDPKISYKKYIIFSEDHIKRMIKNNPNGIYDSNINATENCIKQIFKTVAKENLDKATKPKISEHTIAINKFKKYLERKVNIINNKFKANSNEYLEFFPYGYRSFHLSKNSFFFERLAIFMKAVTKYKYQLDEKFVSEIITHFEKINKAYKDKKDEIEMPLGELEEYYTLKLLTFQLTRNAMAVVNNNIGDVKAFSMYFNISLLNTKKITSMYKGKANAKSVTKVIDIDYSADKQLKIRNKGMFPLTLQLSLKGDLVGNKFKVPPLKTIGKRYDSFNDNGDGLVIMNENDFDVEYIINNVE